MEVQNSSQFIASLMEDSKSKSSTPPENFANICSNAAQLIQIECWRAEEQTTKSHSGFVPLPPLVEVKTNNTLAPSITSNSDFGFDRGR
jgi:hypothetical protein